MRDNRRNRMAAEIEEEREARLQQMSVNQRDSLAAETEEEREARLQHMRDNYHDRLAAETEEEREARLQCDRERHRGQQTQLPLFEQPSVQAKMRRFHPSRSPRQHNFC